MKKQKNKGGWLDKYQDEALPKAQNGIKESINKYLGDPYGEAREFAENPDELANIDNMRHAQATRLTQEAIANKTGNIPLISDTLGLLGSNALGVGHELKTLFGDKDKRDWSTKLQESGEDIFNNLFGSVIGTLPIDDKTKDMAIPIVPYIEPKVIIPDIMMIKPIKFPIRTNLLFSFDGTPSNGSVFDNVSVVFSGNLATITFTVLATTIQDNYFLWLNVHDGVTNYANQNLTIQFGTVASLADESVINFGTYPGALIDEYNYDINFNNNINNYIYIILL